MKRFNNLFLPCFILFIDITTGSQYCDIQFPKPDVTHSTKFDIYTGNGKRKFTEIDSYVPGKTYDITVSVNDKEHLTIKTIYVFVNSLKSNTDDSGEKSWMNGGEILFNVTHASKTDYCKQRASVQYLYTQLQHITFYWIAPTIPEICLRLTVILDMNDIYGQNLIEERSHIICEETKTKSDQMQSDQSELPNCSMRKKPDPERKCNIMSTAVYRMTIENKWNSMNHWRDWPAKDGYPPKLTQYLGASHSSDFNLYHLGGMANDGVLQVCGNGSYNLLQQQFYKAGNGIMTVILARSLDASSKTNKRSALIVVNASAHLISFLSRLEPSPDWCTGLSRFDLCAGKCKWPEEVSVPIYPWDAGMYNGELYLSKKEMHPQSPICPITSNWPKGNPFTVINGKIQDIGLVTFKLIQEYNKQPNHFCNSANSVLQDEAYSNEPVGKSPQFGFLKSSAEKARHCSMTQWSEWSSCSKTCGKGEKVRYRKFMKGNADKCIQVPLKDNEVCYVKCIISTPLETCSLRLWSPSSPCNATCTQPGIKYSERVFINDHEKHDCMVYPGMKSISTCRITLSRCAAQSICKEYVNVGDLCTWFNPSQRYYYDFQTRNCKSFIYKGCYGGLNNFLSYEDCLSTCSSQNEDIPQYPSKTPIEFTNRCDDPVTWGMSCESEFPSTRWSFDKIHRKCFKFHFNGCRGNGNNFKSKEECENVCLTTPALVTSPVTEIAVTPQNCVYSQWSQWSSCDEDCQKLQTRHRFAIEKQGSCDEELRDVRKCQSEQCKIPENKASPVKMCKYSKWSEWTTCSSRCGKGIRERKRKKLSFGCIPEFPQYTERESCYNACAFY